KSHTTLQKAPVPHSVPRKIRRRPQLIRLCGYCGVRQATSRDHVPPENLFAAPRPSNLIAFPACAACHGDTSKDDEYFRTVMALRADIHNHPDIQGGVLS